MKRIYRNKNNSVHLRAVNVRQVSPGLFPVELNCGTTMRTLLSQVLPTWCTHT